MASLQALALNSFFCSFDKCFLTSSGRTRACAGKGPLGEDKTVAESVTTTVRGGPLDAGREMQLWTMWGPPP